MHHTCTCIFKGPLDTSCFKKHFHFYYFIIHGSFFIKLWRIFLFFFIQYLLFFFIQYLLHIHRTVLCKSQNNVYMYMYLRSIIHVYVLPCTPPCSLVMALTNIACQKWGTKIWSLNTKEKMIEQRALTGNMN